MSARENVVGARQHVQDDLEIMPLMNLFVALIPMLLVSAVFLNVTVIDMKAPAPGEAAAASAEALELAVAIGGDAWEITGNGLRTARVPRDGEDALAALETALAAVVAAHPQNEQVVVVSEDRTRYADIIAVMDAARAAGLPGVALLGAQ